MSGVVPVARVVKTRGYRGGLWVEPYLENLAPVLAGADVWAGPGRVSGPYHVAEFFSYSKGSVLRLHGIEDLEAAAKLVGREIEVAKERVPEEGALSFDAADVVGWAVEDLARGHIGEVKAVRRDASYWLFEVKTSSGEAEIPAVTGLGVEVHKEQRRITVNLPGSYPGVDGD